MTDLPRPDRHPPREQLASTAGSLDALVAAAGARHHGLALRPAPGSRRGITAVVSGGTAAKRLEAAESVATAAGSPLLRVDLSSVVSKYIGETEKNLAALFERAHAAGATLFFDEADALFGKRTDVKDAHDRYANLEVSYLLERLESFAGIAILASNRKEEIDPSIQRRLQYLVSLP